MVDLMDIRIGTLIQGQHQDVSGYLASIMPYGFESISITFWKTALQTDLKALADIVKSALEPYDCVVSSVSVFSNPLMDDDEAEIGRESWRQLIDHAADFGCDIVTGFAGRLVDQPVPKSMARYKEVFEPLGKRAADLGVKLAFENCDMGGDWQTGKWNIAFNPIAWDMMFNTLALDNIGLQWEPAHQLGQLIDPMPQLDEWAEKIFILHGKDGSVYQDRIERYGIKGAKKHWDHRHPGYGDSDWTAIISRLRANGYVGSIDIEGWHDPVYKDELEIQGQVQALRYLQNCRGGMPI